jgi:type VII secretion protein EccE
MSVAVTQVSRRRSVLGVRVGQLISWQIVAVAAVFALTGHGPWSRALGGVALAGAVLTMLRWRHRWAFEWLIAALAHRGAASRGLPPVDVSPARLRTGTEAGVAHDGSGFSVIVAIGAQPAGPPVTELPAAALAGLLDGQDALVSAVQLVLHCEYPADGPAVLAAAYRDLGYGQVPRSSSAWLALRHDPAQSRYAIGSAGSARDVRTSLLRGLAGRGPRALDVLAASSLKGRVLDVPAVRELLTKTLVAGAEGTPATRWDAWLSPAEQHVTYWLRRWPADGIDAVQQALGAVPARSITTSVLITAADAGRVTLTATIRVTTSADLDRSALDRAVRAAAASCGAQLSRLDGGHLGGVLATLPLGRPPTGIFPIGRSGGTHESRSGALLPITRGGVVIGAQVGGADDGWPVAVPFFSAEAATRTVLIGDPLLHRLLGLRALGSGARLQVVTSRPGPWLKLRSGSRQPDRMTVVRPGQQQPPSDGTPADPWMLIDDTGSPAASASRPWLAVVTALGESAVSQAIPPGYDAVVVQRSTAALASSLVSSFDLPRPAARSLPAIPDGQVAVAWPGLLRFAQLAPDAAERSILAASMKSA